MPDLHDDAPRDDGHPGGEAVPAADPRDEPAPFGAVVLLTTGSAVAIMAAVSLLSWPANLKLLLLGPITLVVWEVVTHEVWWRRWWGAVPGAVAGLTMYVEGRQALADVIGDAWAHPVAYVTGWALFAVIFAVASRWPRTAFGLSPGPGSSPA
ncbi:hypothetical protein ACWGH8_25795 [Nonomuraea muscovyensis]|uniref:Uncharacterized protein n=1 Tax=Nonomuraea muscovyensis TaxID=1124761 RepID=A0A7X0F2D2_9ACTN|nr:hypothetical protein [Nonomuraea muscovyensis]MBB6350076.1 hypothetical protein [Nonomuraea muscovyensis]